VLSVNSSDSYRWRRRAAGVEFDFSGCPGLVETGLIRDRDGHINAELGFFADKRGISLRGHLEFVAIVNSRRNEDIPCRIPIRNLTDKGYVGRFRFACEQLHRERDLFAALPVRHASSGGGAPATSADFLFPVFGELKRLGFVRGRIFEKDIFRSCRRFRPSEKAKCQDRMDGAIGKKSLWCRIPVGASPFGAEITFGGRSPV